MISISFPSESSWIFLQLLFPSVIFPFTVSVILQLYFLQRRNTKLCCLSSLVSFLDSSFASALKSDPSVFLLIFFVCFVQLPVSFFLFIRRQPSKLLSSDHFVYICRDDTLMHFTLQGFLFRTNQGNQFICHFTPWLRGMNAFGIFMKKYTSLT